LPLFSQKDLLAIAIVVDIAAQGDRLVKVGEIETRFQVPKRHFETLIQALAANGILAGQRGRLGGYELARDSSLIDAGDILRAVRAVEMADAKIARNRISENVVIPALREAERAFSEALRRITVEQLVRSVQKLYDLPRFPAP
jgi:Rrf2 family iron-sulfur cluster assembly transcriptional regulator